MHISTDHLFSGDNALVDESFPVSPINIYGLTKAEAELRVLEENPEALVIRTNFYGWGTSYRQSFSDFIIRTLRAGRKLELFEDVFFTPILAEVVAQTICDLMAKNAKGIFNIVGSQRLSKFDFGLRVAK
ncbi:MAG: SDR family NAD(P)-dependent oxidoreductase, partial [Bacteroidetes bacterium]|nr:SDR family NAD(P)-dependent oxidoreductase [Bacteroidota bacterium]